MPNTSFTIDAATRKRVELAAASLGMSASEYYRRAVVCVLHADAMSNPALAAMFKYEDQRAERVSA